MVGMERGGLQTSVARRDEERHGTDTHVRTDEDVGTRNPRSEGDLFEVSLNGVDGDMGFPSPFCSVDRCLPRSVRGDRRGGTRSSE